MCKDMEARNITMDQGTIPFFTVAGTAGIGLTGDSETREAGVKPGGERLETL